MSWASRRRSLIVGGTIVAGLAIAGTIAFSALNKPPTCFDGKQNQDEEGIDCSGSCQYLCRASVTAPSVRFVLPLQHANGRTEVIAYLDNPNPRAAARNVSFSLELLNAKGSVVATEKGSVDLPPLSTIPVFVSGISTKASSTRAFLTIDSKSLWWVASSKKQQLPRIADKVIGTEELPRLTATVVNDFPTALRDIKLIAAIFDADGNVMAASQTLLPLLRPGESLPAVFTWNEAFPREPVRIDVIPVMPF